MTGPVRVRTRMYQVGLGECVLVSLEYARALADGRAERHVLIDFGTAAGSAGVSDEGGMPEIAELVAGHTGGVLDILVVSHRHADHLSGFADSASAAIMRRLAPKRILRPWTDAPSLRDDGATPSASGLDAESQTFARMLAHAQRAAGRLEEVAALSSGVRRAAAAQLDTDDAEAVLAELGGQDRVRYVAAGDDTETRRIAPGLDISVLGPSTVAQRAERRRAEDAVARVAALHASLREAGASHPAADERRAPMRLGPGPVRSLVESLAAERSRSVDRLVRDLDEAVDDTSLILLLQIGEVVLLFGGDARVRGWQPVLARARREPQLKKALTDVGLYKVGHHGGGDATPRSLYALWEGREIDTPLAAILSTHGRVDDGLPRTALLEALARIADVHSTDDLPRGAAFLELVSDTARSGFARVG